MKSTKSSKERYHILVNKAKNLLRNLFLTKEGILSWLIVNMFWSSFWAIPAFIGFITQDNYWYVISGSILLFFVQPLVPMWLITPLSAFFVLKLFSKKHIEKRFD
jgi:hypothetical protein